MKMMKIRESGSLSKWSHIIKCKTILKENVKEEEGHLQAVEEQVFLIPNFANIATDQELHFKHV